MRRAIDIALLHELDKRVSKLEENKRDIGDIPWLKNRVTDLEYRVKKYPTKDDALNGILKLERVVGEDPPRRHTTETISTDPAAVASKDLRKLLKYAHGRGWLSTVDWDEVRSGKE